MSEILEMIKNEKVEWKKLGDVAKCFSGGTPKTSIKSYYDGEIPWIRSGEIKFNILKSSERNISIDGLNNSSAKMIRANSVVLAMTGATVARCAVVEFETSSNQSVAAIETDESILNYKFLFYYLSNNYEVLKKRGRGALTSLNLSIIKNLEIPIPPLETQQKIVKILDGFSKYSAELQSELQAELQNRSSQYEYFRDWLLSEDYLIKLEEKIFYERNKNIEIYKIKDLCKRQRGIKITAKEMEELNDENSPVKVFAGGNTIAKISNERVGKENIINEPSVIVKSRGNIDFEYYDKAFTHKNEMWSYSSKNENVLNIKFLYYILKNNLGYFINNAISGKLPQISMGVTDNYKILLPSIEIQNKVVEVLDKFQNLISDVQGLLPEEIEQRQKQYEYFREKLLTFDQEAVQGKARQGK